MSDSYIIDLPFPTREMLSSVNKNNRRYDFDILKYVISDRIYDVRMGPSYNIIGKAEGYDIQYGTCRLTIYQSGPDIKEFLRAPNMYAGHPRSHGKVIHSPSTNTHVIVPEGYEFKGIVILSIQVSAHDWIPYFREQKIKKFLESS